MCDLKASQSATLEFLYNIDTRSFLQSSIHFLFFQPW